MSSISFWHHPLFLKLVRRSTVFKNFSEILVKVFDIVFFKNNILNFLEPLYGVDLVAAVRLLSKSNQVLHSKPLWWKAIIFFWISFFFVWVGFYHGHIWSFGLAIYGKAIYGKAIWQGHMAKPYGKAIWQCHMAKPCGKAIRQPRPRLPPRPRRPRDAMKTWIFVQELYPGKSDLENWTNRKKNRLKILYRTLYLKNRDIFSRASFDYFVFSTNLPWYLDFFRSLSFQLGWVTQQGQVSPSVLPVLDAGYIYIYIYI